MVVKQKLTPELFLSAPRRGAAVPNGDGTLAFFTVSIHIFADDKQGQQGSTKKEVALLDLGTGVTRTICNDADKIHDVNWIPLDESGSLLWLRSDEKGETAIVVVTSPSLRTGSCRRKEPDSSPAPSSSSSLWEVGGLEQTESYVAGTIPAPVQTLKLQALRDGSIACAVVGMVGPDGALFNEKTAEKKPSTARIYDSWNVREWDTYVKPERYSIWYSKMVKEGAGPDRRWRLAAPFQNALRDTALESPDIIYEPSKPEDAFDIGQHGIAFAARSPIPETPVSVSCSDVYFLPLESFTEGHEDRATSAELAAATIEASDSPGISREQQRQSRRPTKVALQGLRGSFKGWCTNVRFSPDGTMLAYLKTPLDCYPDTRLLMGHVDSGSSFDIFDLITGRPWHLRPSGFEYHPSGEGLYVAADDCGHVALFSLSLRHEAEPKVLFRQGSVIAFYPLGGQQQPRQLLVSSSSMVESSTFQIVDESLEFEPRVVSSATKDGSRFGLTPSQVSEIYFEGAGDYCVQSWVVRPSDFDGRKKYPLILVIHGGPVYASRDIWETRWNPAVWAEQGYIVVLPNVTGSLGFGVDFSTAVFGEYGGRPYQDLVNCMEYLANIPYIDMDRAIAAGESYGGYMINWIIGHSLAQKFKALLCQDGIFNLPQMMLQQDVAGDLGEFKGPPYPWNNYKELEKWNPAKPDLLKKWRHAPPTLIVHSERDYRCPITEGLAAFRTLKFMGVSSRLLTFPDESHFILKPENALEWHRLVFDWFKKHTRGADDDNNNAYYDPAAEIFDRNGNEPCEADIPSMRNGRPETGEDREW